MKILRNKIRFSVAGMHFITHATAAWIQLSTSKLLVPGQFEGGNLELTVCMNPRREVGLLVLGRVGRVLARDLKP